ncbi:diacylglycerol/lipid kinase family protein [Sinosporangium siamense]|uniref:diacylglycerol/lipid kinase family protein n=1 Tax=Sinosporangium siamense TaxID=1367973 RepID=UPI0027DE967F|nr:YegS/Rv2252/BmrU family lipid kinase [Sinosporangium siamense]
MVNPAARGGRTRRHLGRVIGRLRRGGREVTVIVGTSAADTLARAHAAAVGEPAALVAYGGDGLVHLAVQAVAGTEVPLGIIPAGTGNDFASALGLPVPRWTETDGRSLLAAAGVVAAGRTRTVDAATIGPGEWFAGVAACGFDSRVNERANTLTWPPGAARYVRGLVRELRSFTPIPFALTLDGERVEQEAVLVAVANTRSYGAGMRISPHARPDDGLLDVVTVGAVSRGELLRTFPRVYRGTHLDHPAVTVVRVREVTVEAPGVIAYADGERIGPAPVTCTVVPGALKVLHQG